MKRPPEVMQAANNAWNISYQRALAGNASISDAAKKAQKEYDKVLKKYDRAKRSHS